MPVILKLPGKMSPCVISFTHNEIFNGANRYSKKFHEFLKINKKKFFSGIHFQGDTRWLGKVPVFGWEKFYLWPDSNEKHFDTLEKSKIINLTCSSFLQKKFKNFETPQNKIYDLAVITRMSPEKNFYGTLQIINYLLNLDKKIKIAFICPDPIQYRKLILNIFERKIIKELIIFKNRLENNSKRLSLFCINQNIFGEYPLSEETIDLIIRKSSYLMMNSTNEGVPRVLGQSLLNNVPIILPDNFYSGFNSYLFSKTELGKSTFIYNSNKNIKKMSEQILEIINKARPILDKKKIENFFLEENNVKLLKQNIEKLIKKEGMLCKGSWLLKNLKYRLPCHGSNFSYQFIKSTQSFNIWINKISKIYSNKKFNFYDEKFLYSEAMKKEKFFLNDFFLKNLIILNKILKYFKLR